MSMSSRTGKVAAGAPTAGPLLPPVRLKKSGVAAMRRVQKASRTVTLPLSSADDRVPVSARFASIVDTNPSG